MDMIVHYSGKRLPWTISMPWLTKKPVAFGQTRQAVMPSADAERLCSEAPTDFKIVGPAVYQEPAEDKVESPPGNQPTGTVKKRVARRKAPAAKKE